MKLRSPTLAAYLIASFIVTLAAALDSEKAEAYDLDPYMHVGGQVNASDASMGGGGILYKKKVDFNVTYISSGNTQWGEHDSMRVMSLTRIITPGWLNGCFFMGVGYANVQDTLLVGEHNFNIMSGLQYNWGRIYYNHISDLHIGSNDNVGLDAIHISFDLSI